MKSKFNALCHLRARWWINAKGWLLVHKSGVKILLHFLYYILFFCIVLFLPGWQQLDLCILSFLGKASSLWEASHSPQTSGWGISCLLSSGRIGVCDTSGLVLSHHLSRAASKTVLISVYWPLQNRRLCHFYASLESLCPFHVMLGSLIATWLSKILDTPSRLSFGQGPNQREWG